MHHLTLKRTATIYAFFKFHEADCHQPCWYNRYFFIGTGMGSLSTFPFVRCSFPMDLRIVRLQRSIRGWGSATRKKRKKGSWARLEKIFSKYIHLPILQTQSCKFYTKANCLSSTAQVINFKLLTDISIFPWLSKSVYSFCCCHFFLAWKFYTSIKNYISQHFIK